MDTSRVDDEGLEEMWKEAQVEFRKLSGQDLANNKVLAVGDVLSQIQTKAESDEKASARYKRATDILDKTLNTIQNLGSLIASAASQVFAPANLCFSAVSYLITVAQNYGKIFDGLNELFERICAFLERFEVYARSKLIGVKIDIHLRRIIHELLRCFMRICALSIKISRHSKVLLALKVFSFGSDEGVAAELQKLETLVQRETGMSVALILESVKFNENNTIAGFAETKDSLKALDSKVDGVSSQIGGVSGYFERRENADKRKEAEKNANKDREKIKTALKIEKEETWRTNQENFVREIVPNTGQWLFEDPQFAAWLDGKPGAAPILGVQAKQGFGKSFLCSVAIRHLYSLYPPSLLDDRVSVAYYFFEKDTKDEKVSVNKAIRSIVYQLCLSDDIYQRDVAIACDKPEEFGNTLEMWNQLVARFSKRIDATFYVFLDGIDEAETEAGNPLIQIMQEVSQMWREGRRLSLRFFVTGRPKIFSDLESRPNIALSTIELGQRNGEDILKFIDMRMDGMETMKNTESADIRELRARIRDKLSEGAQGDFFKINYMLSEVGAKKRRKEIEEVLEHAGEDRLETIGREVERLSNTLSAEDIQDFNELLRWVMGSKAWPSVRSLEGALLLKNGEASLVPLEDQIRDKYSAFLEVSEYGTVTTVSDSILEYFKKRAAAVDLASSTTSALHEAEIGIVRRFLRNVCDEELFQKFGFDEFFARKLAGKSVMVNLDVESMDIEILLLALKAITLESTPELDAVLSYAWYWLPEHLEAVDLALTPPEPKRVLGSILIKLFTDETYANRWWSEPNLWMRFWWCYLDDNCNTVLNWFKDSAVQKGFSDVQREWIQGLTSAAKLDDDLLRPLARIMAKRWLQTPDWFTPELVYWIQGYITKIKERKGTGDRIKEDTKPTVEQFLEIEQWAMKELEVTEPDSLWMVQTAITLRHFGHYDLSRERSLKSQEMDPKNWRAPFCLAQISALQGKYEEALTLLDKVIEMFRADNTLLEVWRDTYYDSIIYFQGDWNVEVKQFDKAIASYRQVHSGIPDAYNPILRIMEIFQSQEKYGEIMDCLEAMGSEMNEKGLSHLVAMSFEFAGTTAYHQIIAEAGRKTSREEVVQRVYEDSLEAAKADDMKLLVMTSLRLWYAFHLYYDRKGEGDREKAIQILEENLCVTYKGYQPGIAETKYTTAKRLATLYFHEARNAGAGTERGKDYHDRLVLLSNGKNIRGNDIDTKVDAKLLLARLYFSRGEKELAKSTMRYHIRLGMDLLSDSDESNDWQGYMQLAVALVHADDDADALAAWSLLGPIPDDVTEEKDGEESTEEKEEGESGSQPDEGITETAEVSTAGEDEESAPEDTEVLTPGSPDEPAKAENATEKDGAEVPADEKQEDGNDSAESTTSAVTPKLRSGHLGNICDGECGQGWGYADDIYFCRDCLDVQFGTYCYEKLKGGTLPLRICGQAHEFFHVPPWNDELMAQVPKGSVRVGEEIITIEEWLGRLKEKWGI